MRAQITLRAKYMCESNISTSFMKIFIVYLLKCFQFDSWFRFDFYECRISKPCTSTQLEHINTMYWWKDMHIEHDSLILTVLFWIFSTCGKPKQYTLSKTEKLISELKIQLFYIGINAWFKKNFFQISNSGRKLF